MPEFTDHDMCWIIVYMVQDGGMYHLAPDQWEELRTAHSNWITKQQDSVLEVKANCGADVIFAASRIAEFIKSDPENREAARRIKAAWKAERGYEDNE